MIAQLTGNIRHLTTEKVIVEVGGVGYALSITPRTAAQLVMGSVVTLSTSLIVREDSLTLFGFLDSRDRDIYETLQTVSGIGPKVALSILGALTPSELAQAVTTENISVIEKVPGIGKKGAQRLVLELKSKLSDFGHGGQRISHQPVWREQLASALMSLGFSAKDSDEAINSVLSSVSQEDIASMELGDLLKLALQSGKK